MSKVSKATNMPTIPASEALATHTPSELSNIQVAYKLNRKNYLQCLNVEYDHKRSQVLGRDQLPSLNETISMIQAEEGRFPTTGMARQICPKQTTKIFTGVITVKKPGHEKNRNSKGEQQSNQEQAHFFTTQPGSGLRQDDWTCKRKGWVVVP
ncbi:hypothetical protein CK203_117386 [Vitis vinifera]|uniref:Uncharacterized protein n=1 Tax=Vitis vinifera TaxID=29760 RepID=A0A438FCQ0_VITVI|nr:hypothetical protein CK203_117386 [Vitis vinifera]